MLTITADCHVPEVLVTWVKLDDGMPEHPKVIGLSDTAFRLHVRALCYCARFLTDGHIPSNVTLALGKESAGRELIAAGMWKKVRGGIEIHDFLEYQESREEVADRRAQKQWRRALVNNHNLRFEIRLRDGNTCRYCGKQVSWTDRRGPRAATYDHVDPNKDHTLKNVVVACRKCNNDKGPRTPTEAGMTLHPPPPPQVGPRSEPRSGPGNFKTPDPDPDVQSTPQPPTGVGGGRITRDERRWAKAELDRFISAEARRAPYVPIVQRTPDREYPEARRCPHTPACEDYGLCVDRLALERRTRLTDTRRVG